MPINIVAALRDALVTNLTVAVDSALRDVFAVGAVSSSSATATKIAPSRAPASSKKRIRQQKEITRWSPNRQARRVPIFVQKLTAFELKRDVAAKYGEDAVFVKGKPAPKPLAGPGGNALHPAKPAKKMMPSKKKGTKKAA